MERLSGALCPTCPAIPQSEGPRAGMATSDERRPDLSKEPPEHNVAPTPALPPSPAHTEQSCVGEGCYTPRGLLCQALPGARSVHGVF